MAKGSVLGQGEGIGIANQRPRQGGWSERRAEPTLGWSHRHEHGSWRSLSGFTLIVAVPPPPARMVTPSAPTRREASCRPPQVFVPALAPRSVFSVPRSGAEKADRKGGERSLP